MQPLVCCVLPPLLLPQVLYTDKQNMPHVQEALRIEESEVEAWVVHGIGKKLLDARINQLSRTVAVTRTTHRSFGPGQWQELGAQLSQWAVCICCLRMMRTVKIAKASECLLQQACVAPCRGAAEGSWLWLACAPLELECLLDMHALSAPTRIAPSTRLSMAPPLHEEARHAHCFDCCWWQCHRAVCAGEHPGSATARRSPNVADYAATGSGKRCHCMRGYSVMSGESGCQSVCQTEAYDPAPTHVPGYAPRVCFEACKPYILTGNAASVLSMTGRASTSSRTTAPTQSATNPACAAAHD
jgi:hypothetical protein